MNLIYSVLTPYHAHTSIQSLGLDLRNGEGVSTMSAPHGYTMSASHGYTMSAPHGRTMSAPHGYTVQISLVVSCTVPKLVGKPCPCVCSCIESLTAVYSHMVYQHV